MKTLFDIIKMFLCAIMLVGALCSDASAYVKRPAPPGTPFDAEFTVWEVEEVLTGNTVKMKTGNINAVIRLNGVEVPGIELSEEVRKQAKLFKVQPDEFLAYGQAAKKKLESLMPLGKPFLVIHEKMDNLPNEISGYVWKQTLKDPNSSATDYTLVNADMLASGLGWAVLLPGTMYADVLGKASDSAVKAKSGLWKLK